MEFFQAGLPIFLGGLLQGCTGFGFSLLAVPLLLLSFPGAVVTPLLVLLSLAMNFAVWCDCRCRFSGRTLAGLLLGGVAGLLPGMWALAVLPVRGFRFAAGLIVAASALALLSGFRCPLTPRGGCLFSVGLASGFLNGSLSMSGPPVILFLANQDVGKNLFRSTLASYFLSLNVVTAALFLLRGMIDASLLRLGLAGLPALLAGTGLGILLARQVPEGVFRRLSLALLVLMGLSLTVTALRS